jgi:uncharacterized protein YjbJ (UPF0337 family)
VITLEGAVGNETDPFDSGGETDLAGKRYGSYQMDIVLKGENNMKPSTKDQLEGKLHEAKGKVKEKIGQVTNKPDLEAEGQDEKIAGKVQKKVGQVEKVLEK